MQEQCGVLICSNGLDKKGGQIGKGLNLFYFYIKFLSLNVQIVKAMK